VTDPVLEAVRAAHDHLTAAGLPHALVGGLAVSARGHLRFTRDADFAVCVAGDAEAQRVVLALTAAAAFSIVALVEQEATGRIAMVHLRHAGGVRVDLMFASCGLEADIVSRAEVLPLVPGLSIPVAAAIDLVAMKVLSFHPLRRATDLQDLMALVPTLSQTERVAVAAALRAIDAAGCGRNLDLQARWAEVVANCPLTV
jgi:hypothetical protein